MAYRIATWGDISEMSGYVVKPFSKLATVEIAESYGLEVDFPYCNYTNRLVPYFALSLPTTEIYKTWVCNNSMCKGLMISDGSVPTSQEQPTGDNELTIQYTYPTGYVIVYSDRWSNGYANMYCNTSVTIFAFIGAWTNMGEYVLDDQDDYYDLTY